MARPARFIGLGCLTALLVGCLHDHSVERAALFNRLGIAGPNGPDAVYIEYVLIERPAGNSTVDRDIWADIDEQVISPESRAIANANGLRIGTISGLLPSHLDAMLSNPRHPGGHRQRRLYSGTAATFALLGPVASTEFQLRTAADGPATAVKRDNAVFQLGITPKIMPDGRLQLSCVPEVEYYDKKHWIPIGAVGNAWGEAKPVDRLTQLAWEVTVNPREFIVIGTYFDRPTTLGHQSLVSTTGEEKTQRLFILRAGRLQGESNPVEFNAPPGLATEPKNGTKGVPTTAPIPKQR